METKIKIRADWRRHWLISTIEPNFRAKRPNRLLADLQGLERAAKRSEDFVTVVQGFYRQEEELAWISNFN
jgi:hypothetical protein